MQGKLTSGMIFKDYSELCLFMNWNCTRGNTKKSHLKELDSLCSWEKQGHKIIINDIFDNSKPIVDNRFDKNKFAEHVAIILLLEHSEFTNASIIKIAKNLELIKDLEYNKNSDTFFVNKNFRQIVKAECKRIIESSLKNTYHKKLISKFNKHLMYVPITDTPEPDFSLSTVATEHETDVYYKVRELNKKKHDDEDWGKPSSFDKDKKNYAIYKLYTDKNIELFYWTYDFKVLANEQVTDQFLIYYANKYNLYLDDNVLLSFSKSRIHTQFIDIIKSRIELQLNDFIKNNKNTEDFDLNYKNVEEKYFKLLNKLTIKFNFSINNNQIK